MENGKVYLVGAGPGAKDLISVRGQQVLSQADVVIYDYLVDSQMLEEVNPQAELICCAGFGKRQPQEGSFDSQSKINSAMVNFAKKGKLVARLKNGDPFIFGRAQEEIEALLKNRIEFEVIPGITAAQAAACFSGIPLTSRKISSSVIYVSGQQAKGEKPVIDWNSVSKNETIVLYMAVNNIRDIAKQLIKHGKLADLPVAAIAQAGRINQKIVIAKLENISKVVQKEEITAPAVFIIGPIVRLNEGFDWFKKNKRILFTGLSAKRYFLKGNYFHLPMIKIDPLDNYADFDRQLKEIFSFNWIIFTSRYAVQYFFQRLHKIGLDTRSLEGVKIAAIGTSTAARLKALGIIADLVPKVETSKGLLDVFMRISLKGKTIFLPHSDISDKGLTKGLKDFGAKVISSVAYRNIMPGNLPSFDLDTFDEIIFTSPSGVRNFVKRYGKPPKKAGIKCIGEVTLAQAKKLRLL